MKEGDLFLVIDMQNVYKKGGKWACLNTEGAAKNVCRIIDSGMENTIFTRFIANETNPQGVWKDYNIKYREVNENSWANEMIEEFKPYLERFPLYTKGVYSSASIPQVLEACKKAKRVVVAGVVSDCCVLSTVFELMDYGIYVIYLKDAVSGLDKPKEDAAEMVLSGLCPLHVKMMTTQEYLQERS